MEQNPESALAWQFIESTGTHLFLTGKAGTGKTTFLRKLKQESPKRMVVVAPTGIAAINAGVLPSIRSFRFRSHLMCPKARSVRMERQATASVSVRRKSISYAAWICW